MPPPPHIAGRLRVSAFTLAEVLITLGIIGIVAALTIPSLIAKHQKNILKTQFKKAYTNYAQALELTKINLGSSNLYTDYVTFNGTQYVDSDIFINEFYKQLKVIDKKDYDQPPLNYTKTKPVSDSDNSTFMRAIICAPTNILPDGSSICTRIWAVTISVTADINGPFKGPNAFGHDIFTFFVEKDKDVLVGNINNPYYTPTCTNTASGNDENGLGCSYYALINECPDDSTKTYWECLP